MIRKSIIAAAAALVLAGSISAPVYAAAPKAAPTPTKAAPTAPAEAMPPYADLHKGAVAMLTRFKGVLASPEVAQRLTDLKPELDKLPALEKAFVDAKNAGDEAAAKKASADYSASVQKILELAMPVVQGVGPIQQQIAMGFGQLGATGEKLLKEPDVVAITNDIDATLKPLGQAMEIVGPFYQGASKAAQLRVQQEMKRIVQEELSNQVSNYLQGKAAQ